MERRMKTNLRPPPIPPEDQPPPRKKVRKGTRSCWECKHRKVRCQFASDGDQSCRECLSRGIACHSQDLPESNNTRESERASTNDRLGRVESLLERVLSRLDAVDGIEGAQALPAAGDDGFDSSAAATPAENAPALSLFDNEVLGFRRSDVSTPNITLYGSTSRDLAKLCHALLELLPSENSRRALEEASSSWWLVRAQCFLVLEQSLLSTGTGPAAVSDSPTTIARDLLWVALCLQQLPRGFNTELLELPHSPTRLIAECLKLAHSISSDEALVSSTVGLECLVLQGVLHNNDGKLRSAWLSYRRALNVAQIIGLHRLPPESTREPASIFRPRQLWRHVVYADRYLSLMLGMHHGISDSAVNFKRSENDKTYSNPMDRLCRIAGFIGERNQMFNSVTPSMVRLTNTIDAELMSIDNPMLVDSEESAIPPREKSLEQAQTYSKLMTQLWYYQLIAWLHLPLLLGSGTERRHDYSRQSCLKASRQMIQCYASIRRLTAGSFCCKSLDFQAFTAAVTLLINILGPTGGSDSGSNDWPVIDTVITSLEKLADSQQPDKVATRGLSVLRLLKRVATRDDTAEPDVSAEIPRIDGSGRIKVQIPYFGTIFLDCHPPNDDSLRTLQSRPLRVDSTRSAGLASHNALTPNEGHTTDAITAIDVGSWPETHLELGSINIWSFDPDLTALPSFFPSLEDDWDLAL